MKPTAMTEVPDPPSPVWVYAALVIITLGTLFTRVIQARESLWLDELHTAWVATGPWSAVAARSMEGNQSPLFFGIEWLLVHMLGAGELVLRSPSIAAGVLLPVVLFALVRRWTGSPWLGLLPAWLVCIDQQAAYFGTEARPYALVQLGAVLHVWLFVSLTERPTVIKRIAFIFGAAVLFYLHYTTALLLAAEAVWFVAWHWKWQREAYGLAKFAMDLATAAVLMVGAAPIIETILQRRDNWREFVAQQPLWIGVLMLPWCATALVALLLVAVWRRMHASTADEGLQAHGAAAVDNGMRALLPDIAMVVCWLTLPLLFAWLATTTDVARLMTPRYIAASAPAALVLLSLALYAIPMQRARLGAVVAFAIVGTATNPALRELAVHGRLFDWRTDDWRGAVAKFNELPGHGQGTVLLRSLLIESDAVREHPDDAALIAYLRYPLTSLYKIDSPPERVVPLPRTATERLSEATITRLRGDSTSWLVFQGDPADAARTEAALLEAFGRFSTSGDDAWHAELRGTFGSVRVVQFVRGPRAAAD